MNINYMQSKCFEKNILSKVQEERKLVLIIAGACSVKSMGYSIATNFWFYIFLKHHPTQPIYGKLN